MTNAYETSLVCSTPKCKTEIIPQEIRNYFNCKRCGEFIIELVMNINDFSSVERSMLSHWIRKQQINIKRQTDGTLYIPDISEIINERRADKSKFNDIFDEINIEEKIERIILKIGNLSKFCGDTISIDENMKYEIAAFSGCIINYKGNTSEESEYDYLIKSLIDDELLSILTESQYCLSRNGFKNISNCNKKLLAAVRYLWQ